MLGPLSAVVIGLAGCGGDGDKPAPLTAGERDAVAQLKYCFEGAGALTAKPGKAIPEVSDAKRVLAVSWPNTNHVAGVYYAPSEEAAVKADSELDVRPVQRKGRVIIAGAGDAALTPDEALLASDCLP